MADGNKKLEVNSGNFTFSAYSNAQVATYTLAALALSSCSSNGSILQNLELVTLILAAQYADARLPRTWWAEHQRLSQSSARVTDT